MKYNKREIMFRAWSLYRKGGINFAEALHRAWNSAKARPENERRIEAAKAAAGISEAVSTWAGWKAEGRTVKHGSRALFSVELIHGSRGDGATIKQAFFAWSQTEAAA